MGKKHNTMTKVPETSLTTPDKPVPIETLIEYRKKGLTYQEIGNLVGRTKQTVQERLKPIIDDIDTIELHKKHRADILALQSRRILKSLTNDDIQKTPAGQRVMMYGILYDKERLERGESTANIASLHADIKAIKEAGIS